MLVESAYSPAQLRKNVASPNGTTHAALVTFDCLGFQDMVVKGFKAAVDQSMELGKPSL
jgi:pyrroline-5-carboxylate reductase